MSDHVGSLRVQTRQSRSRGGDVARLVRASILIVDLNMEAAQGLAQRLWRDFSDVVVVSPWEALPVALEREFAVVLAIQRGPGIGGMKFLARVRQRWGRSRGLLMAAYADAESLAEAISSGESSDYLFMPWDEEELLRVRDRRGGFLARERETRDLVRDADQPAQERRALDDRRVAGGVRDGRDVLHQADEELRAADRVELVVRDKLRLHGRESDRLAALGEAGDRAQDDAVLLAR